MSGQAIAPWAGDDRVARWIGRNIVRGLTLASVASIFAISPLMLYDWGFKYGDAGGSIVEKVHPGTWLALLAVVATGLGRGNLLFALDDFVRSRAVAAYLLGLGTLFAFTIEVRNAPFTPWIDTFVLPALLYVLIQNMETLDKRRAELIIHVLLNANAALGLYENITGYRLTSFVAGQFLLETDWRSTALLGHPLANALATGTYAIILGLGGGRDLPGWLRLPVLGLQLIAMVAFGGRTSLVMTLLILAFVGLRRLAVLLMGGRFDALRAGLLFMGLPALGAVILNGAGAGFFDRMIGRFIDDNGSASARVVMLRLFDYISWEGIVFGPDPTLIGPLQYMLGIEYGIESFWVAFVLMNGLAVSLVFFAGLAAFSWRLFIDTRPATLTLLFYYYFIASTSVSMSSKTCALGIFATMILTMMRAYGPGLKPAAASPPTASRPRRRPAGR